MASVARGSTAIVWFRRDLRVHDHPALAHAIARFERVLPGFVVDPGILDGRWQSANRRWFLAGGARCPSWPRHIGLPGAAVHKPPPRTYLPPIVSHAEARTRALDAYGARARRARGT